MKVLIISLDKGLLGQGQLGDVIERHRRYGELAGSLDIIVLSLKGYQINHLSERVTVYSTNSRSKFNYWLDAWRLGQKLFTKTRYDLIVTQDPFLTALIGWQLKKKFSSRLLVHFHGDFWQNGQWLRENWLNYIWLLISKFTVGQADAIRVMSQGQKAKLLAAKVSAKKIRVISTPVDLEKYDQPYLEVARSTKPAGAVILHVGRDDKVKDYNTLIEAFKAVKGKLPDTKFVQAGADKIIKEAMQKNDFTDIDLKYNLRQGDLINLYHLSEIVVLSSTSESFGKVLVEANACGKPVVSTATTGAKEIIQDGYNGFLVHLGDASAVAEKIIYLLNNPQQAKVMGQNGQRLVKEKFDGKINTVKIIEFWRDIINNQL